MRRLFVGAAEELFGERAERAAHGALVGRRGVPARDQQHPAEKDETLVGIGS